MPFIPAKALDPIEVSVDGNVSEVTVLIPSKAPTPTVSVFSKVILVKAGLFAEAKSPFDTLLPVALNATLSAPEPSKMPVPVKFAEDSTVISLRVVISANA